MKELKYLLDLQLFAEDEEDTPPVPPKDEEVTVPPKVEPKDDEDEDDEDDKKQSKSYVKIREEKARKSLLKQLGVDDVEDAKAKLDSGKEALAKIAQLEARLASEESKRINQLKNSQLTNLLDKENVFDSEALLHYLDLDTIELSQDGSLKDPVGIVEALKARKPNYFGKEFVRSDAYIKGTPQNTSANSFEEAYKNGDYVGATASYLKSLKNKK